MKFKKFNQKERGYIGDHVMFVHHDGVVRFGYLHEDYHGNGHSTFFFKTDDDLFLANACLWCPVEVEG